MIDGKQWCGIQHENISHDIEIFKSRIIILLVFNQKLLQIFSSFKPFFIPLVNPAKNKKKKAFEIGSRKNRIGENVIYFKWNIRIKWITILLQSNIIHSFILHLAKWIHYYRFISEQIDWNYYVRISRLFIEKRKNEPSL